MVQFKYEETINPITGFQHKSYDAMRANLRKRINEMPKEEFEKFKKEFELFKKYDAERKKENMKLVQVQGVETIKKIKKAKDHYRTKLQKESFDALKENISISKAEKYYDKSLLRQSFDAIETENKEERIAGIKIEKELNKKGESVFKCHYCNATYPHFGHFKNHMFDKHKNSDQAKAVQKNIEQRMVKPATQPPPAKATPEEELLAQLQSQSKQKKVKKK